MHDTPDAARVVQFIRLVLALQYEIPFSVTSWGRTVKRNREVGGHPHSRHLDWEAADLVPDDPSYNGAIAARARGLGLVAIDEGDHVHVHLPPAALTT